MYRSCEVIAQRVAEEFGHKIVKPENQPLPEEYNAISGQIVKAAYQVHKTLGPGLLEYVYETCLHGELISRGLKARRQVPVDISYKDETFHKAYRIDIR